MNESMRFIVFNLALSFENPFKAEDILLSDTPNDQIERILDDMCKDGWLTQRGTWYEPN
mgnify:CR=1 FL=1